MEDRPIKMEDEGLHEVESLGALMKVSGLKTKLFEKYQSKQDPYCCEQLKEE